MVTKWTSIAGRKENDGIDFYETPIWCTDKILEKVYFEWQILEPCCWAWAISKILEKKWYNVISYDIREDDGVYWKWWIDFLNCKYAEVDNIMTNPPFCKAQEIIEKSLNIVKKWWKVVMFLKLQFLEASERYNFFKDTPLKIIWVHSKRPTL